MAAEEDSRDILETMEEGKNDISESEGAETGRLAGTSDSQQPERLPEESADVKCGVDK